MKGKTNTETWHKPTSIRIKRGSALERWMERGHPDLGPNPSLTAKLHKMADLMEAEPLTPTWAGEFDSFADWVSSASRQIAVGDFEAKAICVDTLGRRCHQGGDFMRARDEGTFPVRFFWRMGRRDA